MTFLLSLVFVATALTAHHAVLYTELEELVFEHEKMTTPRRGAPKPQLQCLGQACSANDKGWLPRLHCVNAGSSTGAVIWKCKTWTPGGVEPAKYNIQCEGARFDDDPFVTAGSCSVTYEVDITKTSAATHKKSEQAPAATQKKSEEDLFGLTPFVFLWYISKWMFEICTMLMPVVFLGFMVGITEHNIAQEKLNKERFDEMVKLNKELARIAQENLELTKQNISTCSCDAW